ncbi:hypothetical protein M409DRAFT_60159 [Zasmidium cellare ATCC 36951]|uniref:DUF7136 domain-containing protein n=1 Tax=Zasmidium cellare ATCC 36951 TaxID=1080233 RepID=A0A6A6BZP4_ZASCE|nr:uncharacterized protein M409DRAFT_60159 [Zasmidium cellare ATCC 36951]KAF2160251.1 hypothetical protein M409DRAFT_60159 [Zasmidium cellare ATCC 36951]
MRHSPAWTLPWTCSSAAGGWNYVLDWFCSNYSANAETQSPGELGIPTPFPRRHFPTYSSHSIQDSVAYYRHRCSTTFRMGSLAYLALAATLASPLARAAASPGTFEIDLIFPKNDTYAPVQLMPVIFALKNPALASPLDVHIRWLFNQRGNINSPGSWSHDIDLRHLNASTSDPYLSISSIPSLSGIEGAWALTWILTTGNCSGSEMGVTSFDNQDNVIIFTTRNTSQPPDLEAATSPATCDKSPGTAFNVTAIEEITIPQNFDGQSSCAVLGASPTTRDPCAVTINPSAASSMTAAISASACSASVITCPPSPSSSAKSDAGRPLPQDAAWLFITLAALTRFLSGWAS